MYRSIMGCPWCEDDVLRDPSTLCPAHLAEHEGLTVVELERSEREWATDRL